MNEDFVRARITQLRMRRGISEYQMSLDLGMSKGYVQSISSGNALPSLKLLFNICDYFGISLREFFDETPEKTNALSALEEKLVALDVDDLHLIETVADRLIDKKRE